MEREHPGDRGVSRATTEDSFTRMYEKTGYEFPNLGQPKLLFDPGRDTKMTVRLAYADEEAGGEEYLWEGEFQLQTDWIVRTAESRT